MLNHFKRVVLLTFLLAAAWLPAYPQTPGYVTVKGSHLVDSTGTTVANATISFSPVSNSGAALSFRVDGDGQAIASPVSTTVTNGAFSIQLADTSLTSPVNVCYSVSLVDNVTGKSLLGPGYSCVQPASNNAWCASGTCNFDDYLPASPANTVTTSPHVSIGTVTGGSTAAATITGTNPNYLLNLTLPFAPEPSFNLGTMKLTAPGTDPGMSLTGGPNDWTLNFDYPSGTSAIPGGNSLSEQYNNNGELAGITGAMNVDVPVFSAGAPVLSLTVSGSCTSNPTIAISAPQDSSDGSQALASGYCINGQVQSNVTFPGGGYNSATCSITGGGTSGATCSVNLEPAGAAADPTGTTDSTAAIQTAIDYGYAHATNKNTVASVYIPQGEYNISEPLEVPCDMWVRGDGQSSTILNLTSTNEDGIDVTVLINHPDQWDCRGGIKDLGILAAQGAAYTATQLQDIGTAGHTLENLTIAGGGGRGLQVQFPTERLFARNIEIDTVRWPLIFWGNESHLIKLNIASPGYASTIVTEPDGTQGYYCFGTGNCVNGEYPSKNWYGGTLESASSNGSTASFYVHSSYATFPNSPIIAGMRFTVVGTTGTSLDGDYIASAVTNNVTSDPSGQCSSTNVCFEVQAASTVSGTATLTAPTTTATFNNASYTITVASAAGFEPWEVISGTGIPGGTRVQSINGDVITISNATTAAETSETITGQTGWYPELAPDSNSAVTFGSAAGQIMDGSIKSDDSANCIQTYGTFGSSISNIYCEGFPEGGQPTLDSTLRYGGNPPYTTLTQALGSTTSPYTTVGVASTLWFYNYENSLSQIYGNATPAQGEGAFMLVEPQDFSWGSTTPSAYVPGVEQGQYEVVWGVFTSNDQFVVTGRNQSGSTAPANTAWPAGSYLALGAAFNGTGYGNLTLSNMHPNVTNGPSSNWGAYCNDQSKNGNVCGEFILGSLTNEHGSFTVDQTSSLDGIKGAGVTFLTNEPWGSKTQGSELVGTGFIKSVGSGGSADVLGYGELGYYTHTSYGSEATNGYLYNDGFVNVTSFDGSVPGGEYSNEDGSFWNANLATQGQTSGEGVVSISTPSWFLPNPGSPVDAAVGLQFQNSYCYWDTSSQQEGHPTARWCFVGGPQSTYGPTFRMDTWNGSSWVNAFNLNANTVIPSPSGTNNWSGANNFTGVTTLGATTGSYWQVQTYNLTELNSSGQTIARWDQSGDIQGKNIHSNLYYLYNGYGTTNTAAIGSSAAGVIDMNDAAGANDDAATVKAAQYDAGGKVGYSGTLTPTTAGCTFTVTGGLITGESGC